MKSTRELRLAGEAFVTYHARMKEAKGDTVEKVKERLSVVDVVSGYVKLTRAGSSYKARCPFHSEKSPSFMVSPERGTYHCFGCGVGGDIFTFVQEIEGVDFKGALKILAERAGVPLVYSGAQREKDGHERLFHVLEDATTYFVNQLTKDHPARNYLKERGLTDETIESFRIGWASDEWRNLSTHLKSKGYTDKELLDAGLTKEGDKGAYDRFRSRIIFPLNDAAGRPIAFSGRIFVPPPGKPEDDIAKYLNSPETALFKKSRVLYGFDRAKQSIRKLNFAILVEGQMDLVMVHQAGWVNTVAVSGTALTEEHVALLRRMSDNLLLALDVDAAGIAAAQKSAKIALAMGMDVKVAALSGGKDPADMILHDGKEKWNTAVRNSTHIVSFLLSVLKEKARDDRSYVKEVEKLVLPFVARILSPIDREHFISTVAGTIHVPEDAVREGVQRALRAEEQVLEEPQKVKKVPPSAAPKILEAWGILLAQEAAQKPLLDITEAQEQFKNAVGEGYDIEGLVPEHEREAARIRAEEKHNDAREMRVSFEILIRTIEKERLKKEYGEAAEALKEAELSGDQELVEKGMRLCTTLSSRLAKLG